MNRDEDRGVDRDEDRDEDRPFSLVDRSAPSDLWPDRSRLCRSPRPTVAAQDCSFGGAHTMMGVRGVVQDTMGVLGGLGVVMMIDDD